MNFTSGSLPIQVHVVAMVICLVWIGSQLVRVTWREVRDGGVSHRWLGSMVIIALLWSMKGSIAPGFDLHLLGASVATLMLGFPLATLALVVGAAGATLNGGGDWLALPVNLCIGAMLPALVTHFLLRYGEKRMPPNFFIYIFVFTCFSAALGVVLAGVVATGLLAAFSTRMLSELISGYLLYFVLVAFSEAWLSGAVITLMTVWLPDWVATFDENRYIHRP